jgi:hypothetical protein
MGVEAFIDYWYISIIIFILGLYAHNLYQRVKKDGLQCKDIVDAAKETSVEYNLIVTDVKSIIENPNINDTDTIQAIKDIIKTYEDLKSK